MEHAVAFVEGPTVTIRDLPPEIAAAIEGSDVAAERMRQPAGAFTLASRLERPRSYDPIPGRTDRTGAARARIAGAGAGDGGWQQGRSGPRFGHGSQYAAQPVETIGIELTSYWESPMLAAHGRFSGV